MNDDIVLDYFYGVNRKRLNKRLLHNIPNNIKEYLINRYKDSASYEETIIRMLLHIDMHPLCICGKPCKFIGKRSRVFLKSCGNIECEKKIIQHSIIDTCMQLYGVENTSKLESNKEKRKNTCLLKYGVKTPLLNNSIKEKTKNTNINKYGCEIAQQSNKIKSQIAISNKKTCLKRYGVDNVLKIQCIKDKRLQTCLERYGVDNVLKVAEIQQKINITCLEKYGVPYATQNDEIKQKILDSFIQHNLEMYGCAFPIQNESVKSKAKEHFIKSCIQKYGVDNPSKVSSIYEKIIETKKRNHTFNVSNTEDEIYILLKNKFSNVERNHKDYKYPFLCDFYIKDIDTYIECNFHWTHGGHWYDENNIDDLNKIVKWKAKETEYYNNAINTWTKRDIHKLQIATANKINYVVFWNRTEAEVWIKNYC